jgi:hypothetical protein
MLEEGKNYSTLNTAFERKISLPLLKNGSNDYIILDNLNKLNIQKKNTNAVMNLDNNKVESLFFSTEESDKLTLNRVIRRDGFGNFIKKRSKTHKLRFKDKDFIETVHIESWKKYNTFNEKDSEKGCGCNCIFI